MWWSRARLGGIVVLAWWAMGCAQQLTRIETQVDQIAREQKEMEKQLGEEMTELRGLFANDEVSGQERGAELESRLASMERRMGQLMAQSQEQQNMLLRIAGAVDLMQRESVPPAAAAVPGESAPSAPRGSTGGEVFDAAFADFTRGNYTLARDGFEELLASYPRSELADDAAYWIAETYYAQGNYTEALSRFESVLQRYPDGDTLAASLLKTGYCLLELGEERRAADAFRRLQREFPDSDEALIAEHKLNTLQESP